VCPPVITGMTGKDVEPTVGFEPSEFETVAVSVAVPTDRPWTTTFVLWVNVPVGLTIAAGPLMESEIASVFPEGETVAVVVAVCPTATLGILENETVGVTLPGSVDCIGVRGQGGAYIPGSPSPLGFRLGWWQ
jgi:hypothetical protein